MRETTDVKGYRDERPYKLSGRVSNVHSVVKRTEQGEADSDRRLPTAPQTKQGRAVGRSRCTCNADPSPPNPTPGPAGACPGPPAPAPGGLAWPRGADAAQPGLEPGPGIPLPTTRWETPQAAGAGVAAPHFCPFHLVVVSLTPPLPHPELFPQGGHPPSRASPGGGNGRTPSPCREGFSNSLNKSLSGQVPPTRVGARRASPKVLPGERGWTRSHLGPRLTCGRGRRGPSGGSPPRRGPQGGRLRGLAAHGRGGGRGWLPASALPRPGGRGRSVGAARQTHLAGSHPSARRGARWERGPGRRGQAALTRRTAEAPAQRRVCLRGRAGEAARYSLRGEGAMPPSPCCGGAGDGTEG